MPTHTRHRRQRRRALPAVALAATLAALVTPPAGAQAGGATRHVFRDPPAVTSVNSRVIARIRVPDSPVGHRFDLRLHTKKGWHTFKHTKVKANHVVRFRVPTFWYGKHHWRVVDHRSSKVVHRFTETIHTPALRGSASSFSPMDPSSPHLRWNPCHPVRYKINYAHAPRHAARLVRQSLHAATRASGIRFRYKGSTRAVTRDATHMRYKGIVFAWASERQVPGLRGSTVGRGSIKTFGKRIAYGGVVIQRSVHGSREERSVLLHEIGHVLGLGHVSSRSQIMYPSVGRHISYGAGDVHGLALHGLNEGCLRY